MSEGWVYVISNPAMPELVKVGFTTKHPRERARELNGTGVPDSFVAEYGVHVQSPNALERAVHDHLREIGLAAGKEWFKCPKEQAVAAILEIGAEEIEAHYCPEDEARRLRHLDDRRVEQERARVREEILRRIRQDKEKRQIAQRSREKARQEAKDRQTIERHQEQIKSRRSELTAKLKSRHSDVFLEEVDRIRLWPVFCLVSASGLVALAVVMPTWSPDEWLATLAAVPFVAGVSAVWLRKLIIRVRKRSRKWEATARTKERLLKSIDEVLPYPSYDWFRDQVKGEPPRFLGPLPVEAARRISVNGNIDEGNQASLRGLVHNANSDWVISGVDLRVPEGYWPPSVRLPLCVLPGERAAFNVRLRRRGARDSGYRRPRWAAEEIDERESIGVGCSFGYKVSRPSSEISEIVGSDGPTEADLVPWSQRRAGAS